MTDSWLDERPGPADLWGPKDYINISNLQTMASGIPLFWALVCGLLGPL